MKPWENYESRRDPRDKVNEPGCPVRSVEGLGIMVIEIRPNSIYIKAAKYGFNWWGHVGILQDRIVQHENKLSGLPLCEWCDATGNEMYSMYRKCPKCNGRGVIVEAKS